MKLELPGPDAREGAMAKILRTFLDEGVNPKGIYEGASLETRFLEITGGVYDGASST